ncbi:MAG: flagellar basal body P-ring protein FlgI [Phycisphaeraceae bacterium]|nr:flagellar basal body P-ring protein FlgI [Phycisphaerales bacterium]MCB9843014.1 flagellar basal body P-ring protein FlgI [Phycisphaeraceae bacterium]
MIRTVIGGRVRRALVGCVAAGVICAGAGVAGCSGNKKPVRLPQPEAVPSDVPEILRNTIGAECRIGGLEPTLATGYGLVVGLNGTGSKEIPLPIRNEIVEMMERRGIGRPSGSFAGMTPDELIDDPNTAVVSVEALIPPGSPEGSRFDILVRAVPGSSTTSLEGGTLWTTELREGALISSGPDRRIFARANGPIFINPFADPAVSASADANKIIGRVLDGGQATISIPLSVTLNNPSHARARAIVSAINGRFPKGAGREPTARGRNEELIAINVPYAYSDRTGEFVQLIRHMRIDQQFAPEWAQRYATALKDEPELAERIGYCLEALGEGAIPAVRDLYTYGEVRPRFTALRVGARLGDVRAVPYLQELVEQGRGSVRIDAVKLLGRVGSDPSVNRFLRGLLDDADLAIRINAFESLMKRADPMIRRTVVADKFVLAEVPSRDPMIYVTQQGEPTIALFGGDEEVERPTLLRAWDGRLMMEAPVTGDVRLFYRDYRTGRSTSFSGDGSLGALIRRLAHKPTPEKPEAGFDLSYSEVVGALSVMIDKGAVLAALVPENDRLQLEMARMVQTQFGDVRPELSDDGAIEELTPGDAIRRDTSGTPDETEAEREERRRRYVVPAGDGGGG